MARPTKEEVRKREAAKKRVDELFGDIVKVDIKNATQVVKKIDELQAKGGTNKWLQDQVTELSEKNKALEEELIIVKENYNKLLQSVQNKKPINDDSDEIKRGIRAIFYDLKNNYEGNNQTRIRYTDAKIHILLDKFLRNFPFLLEEKR